MPHHLQDKQRSQTRRPSQRCDVVLIQHDQLLCQPRTQALFSTLLAGGTDPGECWSRGSQILGATNDSCGGRWVVLVNVCNSNLNSVILISVARVTFTQ